MLIVTRHAVERYQERVENVPEIIVRQRLAGRAFETAIAIGAKYVRLGGGHLAVIDSGKVVTVLAREMGINAHVGDREGRVR